MAARIVILGAGFGGLGTALELERTLARDPDVEVTLVNRENFTLFTPMLHEVAASDLDLSHIVNPIRKLLRRVRFFEGDVEHIDLEAHTVRVSHGEDHHHHDLPFDHLVLALGSVTNFFGIPGLEGRAMTMKWLGDAIALRNRLIEQLEEADFECSAGSREHHLTVVVAGGGFAGVETVAAINDFLREALASYAHLREGHLRLVLVHAGELILPELGPALGAYAGRKLASRGVEVRTNARVVGVGPAGVELSDGTRIRAKTIVWSAGTSPNPLLDGLNCARDRGRILVDEFMRVKGHPGIWALGDCASIPDRRTGGTHPPTAQHALRQGRVLGRNIAASLRGGSLRPFEFRTLGKLAAIGRRTGVAEIFGFKFSGFLAWWMWRTVYLAKLPRFEKKVRVALDWTLDLMFSKDLVQFQTFRSPGIAGGERAAEAARSELARLTTLGSAGGTR